MRTCSIDQNSLFEVESVQKVHFNVCWWQDWCQLLLRGPESNCPCFLLPFLLIYERSYWQFTVDKTSNRGVLYKENMTLLLVTFFVLLYYFGAFCWGSNVDVLYFVSNYSGFVYSPPYYYYMCLLRRVGPVSWIHGGFWPIINICLVVAVTIDDSYIIWVCKSFSNKI